jgi:sulfofructose kinase
MKSLDCIFFGAAAYDNIFLVDEVPLSDQRIRAENLVQCGGGPAATAAVALQSLGMNTSLVSAIGDDLIGRIIYEELLNYGINLDALQVLSNKRSTVASISVEKTGKRTITYFGGCLHDFNIPLFDKTLLEKTKCVHLDGNNFELAIEIAKSCSSLSDTIVSLDGGNMRKEDVFNILPYTDIFIPDNKTTDNILGGPQDYEEACKLFHSRGAKIVCITLGDEGCICYNGEELIKIPAYTTDVIDTTGAGDNFHGAFLYGYLKQWDLVKVLHFASAFASITCSGLGGRGKIPTEKEVEELINSSTVTFYYH